MQKNSEISGLKMAKKRMGTERNRGLLAASEMVQKFSECIVNYGPPRTLSEALVELLNGDEITTASKERVSRIIQLLRNQQEYLNQLIARPRDQRLAEMLVRNFIQFNSELNERLLRYKIIPQIDPLGPGPMLHFLAADGNRLSREDWAEDSAVMGALQLVQQNQIESVRECTCQRFFVPERIDQRFCSVKCRVKAHQSSGEFKAKRRAADRERYRLHRDGSVKETNGRKNGTQKTR